MSVRNVIQFLDGIERLKGNDKSNNICALKFYLFTDELLICM